MKKYLLVVQEWVCDEGKVGLIKVVTEKDLKGINSIKTGFGNMEGETIPFDRDDLKPISEEEIKVLEKFGLTGLKFGTCYLDEDECGENED